MKNKILIVCCTRGRSERAKEMFVSLRKTSSLWDIVFCLDHDDETLPQYNEWQLFNERIIGCGQTTTQMINIAFQEHQDYAYYSTTNDDVVYETINWDKALMNKGKISYGNDCCQGSSLPTFSVIDGDIIRALGWLQMPKLTHLYGDCVWRTIGQSLNILKYNKDIITRHNHFMYNKKILKDETYEKTNSNDMYLSDARAFEDWIANNMINDCNKIKEILCHR